MTPKLNKADILTTPARQILFNSMMQGFNIEQSAEKAKLKYQYARQLVTKGHVNALVEQEMGIIAAATSITVGNLQRNLIKLRELAIEKGKLSVAVRCDEILLKSTGGMTGDKPHPDTLEAKRLDGKRAAGLRQALEAFYKDKYLAGGDSSNGEGSAGGSSTNGVKPPGGQLGPMSGTDEAIIDWTADKPDTKEPEQVDREGTE